MKLFTEQEVESILRNQRDNCYVAILTKTRDHDLALVANKAPEPGMWRYVDSNSDYIIDDFTVPNLKAVTYDFLALINKFKLESAAIGYLIGIYAKHSRIKEKQKWFKDIDPEVIENPDGTFTSRYVLVRTPDGIIQARLEGLTKDNLFWYSPMCDDQIDDVIEWCDINV